MTDAPLRPSVPLTFHHEPKVWIGCLECYNAGRLVGAWYAASEAAGITTSELHARDIPADTHEELWCLDIENFPEAKEMDPTTAQMWGDLYEEVGDAQWSAFCAWVRSGSHVEGGDGMPDTGEFEDRYAGEWDSWDEYVRNYVEGTSLQEGWPDDAIRFFDMGRYGRELLVDYSVEDAPNGGVFIFRDN